jgi:arylamine N-acetyltransferase
MFRKLILTAAVVTGTIAGLTATPATAAAQPPRPIPHGPHGPGPHGPYGPSYPQRDRHDYVVLVRHHGHWDRYRLFDDRSDAERAVWRLERQGYDARIQVIHRHW